MLVEKAIAEQAGEVEFYLNEIEKHSKHDYARSRRIGRRPWKASGENSCPVDNLSDAD